MLHKGLETRIRHYISKRVLACMDYLPRFVGGPLRDIQRLRHHQRKRAKVIFKATRAPLNSSIKLRQMEVLYFYELEDFSTIHQQLGKIFQNNRAVLERLEKIIESETHLDGLSWTNLGTVISQSTRRNYTSDATRLKGFPLGLDRVHISHFRVLPSLAALQFSFSVPDQLVQEIQQESNKLRYPSITSNSLWPSKLFKGYSMELRTDATEAISQALSNYNDQFKAWVSETLRLESDTFNCRSTINVYQLQRDNRSESLGVYCNKNRSWLEQFGYDVHRRDNYSSAQAVLSPDRAPTCNIRTEVFFYEEDPSDDMDEFRRTEIIKGIALHSGSLAQAAHYRAKFESVRVAALKYLKRSRRKLHKLAGIAVTLNLTVQSVKRMASEINHSRAWSFKICDNLISLTAEHFKQTHAYPDDTLGSIKYNLQQVIKSSRMISPAIQDQMNADNISVMYTLQNRVFLLTIVSAVVAGVGLLATWDKISDAFALAVAHIAKYWT